jgi:hypothetical protein
MARDHDGVVARGGEIFFCGLDHPADTSTGRIIDKWVDDIPVGVADVKYIGLSEGDGYIAIRVRGTIFCWSARIMVCRRT